MKHIIFEENTYYDIALLIKQNALNKAKLENNYIEKLKISPSKIIAFDLKYNSKDKAPIKESRKYITHLLKALTNLKIHTLYVCDSTYFSILTGTKAATSIGYVKKCIIKDYENLNIILGINYQSLFYNPRLQEKLDVSLETLENHITGFHINIGTNILNTKLRPSGAVEIATFLDGLHKYNELTCDIEAFSLKFYKTGIGTIAFSWDSHNGGAFPVDYEVIQHPVADPKLINIYGKNTHNPEIKELLKKFFKTYKGKITYHNANYDVKVMIHDLFMANSLDTVGMLEGIKYMGQHIDDTKLIAYLALNSCTRVHLGLKELAQLFAGDYAEDVTDITKNPLNNLLDYNQIDTASTWHVKNKYMPIILKDDQQDIYENIMLPSVRVILQMELTGVPIDMPRVLKVEQELLEIQAYKLDRIMYDKYVLRTETLLENHFLDKDFQDRKARAKKPENIKPKLIKDINITFNPGSHKQLGILLHDILGLPILDTTNKGAPATGNTTLEKLINHTNNNEIEELLEAIIDYGSANKITTTFIKAFKENSILKDDGIFYLHGSFNLGGTVSGRLSSSQPNLQNLPSSSKYAKLIKSCFISPKGWIMVGADFDSLEDKISALTTKDPNKLKVYEEHYDGHCLRAFHYFRDQMPDIVDTVTSINHIATKYPKLRQASKAPTFALTYQGTWITLMNNLGWSEEKAKKVEANYHILYKIADKWVTDKLNQATYDGYITCAFGLRVRTPILKQSLLGKKSTTKEAEAESRTAGNALGQSYGLLNNRAGIEFQERVLVSKFKYDIKPIMQIHDAMYFIVKNNLGVIKWFNDNLPACMAWQKLSELQHDKVKLSGSVELFYPNWATKTALPNNISKQEIVTICKNEE